jgi:hypothetical protein
MEVFGVFKGGDEIRFSMSGIDFGRVYVKGLQARERMKLVVTEMKLFFDWINQHTFIEDKDLDPSREVTNLQAFHERANKTISNLRRNNLFGETVNFEIADFRILFITQMCALGGIHLRAHPILTKFMYVAKDTGGYNMLAARLAGLGKDGSKKPTLSVNQCQTWNDTLGCKLLLDAGDLGNCMECLGCESQEKRRGGNVRDVFMAGQNLYTFGADGTRYIKLFGQHVWMPMDLVFPWILRQPGPPR